MFLVDNFALTSFVGKTKFYRIVIDSYPSHYSGSDTEHIAKKKRAMFQVLKVGHYELLVTDKVIL